MADDFDTTSTLRKWFDEFTEATGEKPDFIVFGPDPYADEVGWADVGLPPRGVVTLFDVSADYLDVEFEDGYGSTESPDLCAWSPSWVVFSQEYDGSEALRWVPRNPQDHTPIRPGG
jgi:hypothetical protein